MGLLEQYEQQMESRNGDTGPTAVYPASCSLYLPVKNARAGMKFQRPIMKYKETWTCWVRRDNNAMKYTLTWPAPTMVSYM